MFALARVLANGDPDPSFGVGGKRLTPIGAGPAMAHALGVQADGKILRAGEVGVAYQRDFAVARYTPDGAPDATFGGTGVVTAPVGTMDDAARALAVQRDGKILVAGFALTLSSYDFALVRYLPDGTLDGSFGTGGRAIHPLSGGLDEAEGLAVQGDGKIVVAGKANVAGANAFGVMKLNADGTPDGSFGPGGQRTTAFGGGNAGAEAVALQWDGKVVAAGTTGADFALARYLNTVPAGCLPLPPQAPVAFTPAYRVYLPGVAAGACAP
jgi:uncharacterized delta-60 repeat protein